MKHLKHHPRPLSSYLEAKKARDQQVQDARDEIIHKVWSTIKTYRASGRPWIQIQKMRLKGIHGVLVVDSFYETNRLFASITTREAIAALEAKRALFITAGTPSTDLWWGREPIVTDWIAGENDLVVLNGRLASYFDLCAFVATKTNYVQGSTYLRTTPDLIDWAVLPACQREAWKMPVWYAFPDANFFEYRFETQRGLWKALRRIDASFATRADICEELRRTRGRAARQELRAEINNLAKAWGWHQNDGKALVPVFERWSVMKYLQRAMIRFARIVPQLRWGELPQRKQKDEYEDRSRYSEAFEEYTNPALCQNDEETEYTEAVERYRTRGCVHDLVTPDGGKAETVLHVWQCLEP